MSDHTRTDLVTLSRHVLAEQRAHKDATGDLTLLLISIQLGCKFVATCVRKAGIVNLTGLAGETNVQGEAQKKLDVLANEIFINSLKSSGKVGLMVSEEDETVIVVGEKDRDGGQHHYAVVFDPLDGSSNIEAGVSIGTIFGIYRINKTSADPTTDVLRPGREMVCAGYCMYGSSTNLVLSTGNKSVNGYTLDTTIGEFILTHPNIQVPSRGKIYSVNEGNAVYWDKACTEYFASVKTRTNPKDGKPAPYSARYVGSMVADVHRTLLYGGIFAYPADAKSKDGKLRVLYECFPMAFLMENAGGKASTGKSRMLDLVPTKIHQRSPIFLGSAEDVAEVEALYAKHA
ncbi:putative FBP1-fructose-1,6-bisphosphatase [Blastocladiella britannica]|nr:putative FBP1-fructose-1,6-bisphosphatase [Blastocladiella britannica]